MKQTVDISLREVTALRELLISPGWQLISAELAKRLHDADAALHNAVPDDLAKGFGQK